MARSLVAAGAFWAFAAGLWLCLYEVGPAPQPWDLYVFVLLSLGVPVLALATTLAFVAKELPKPWGTAARRTSPWWQSIGATLLSFAHFLAGCALFLAPMQH